MPEVGKYSVRFTVAGAVNDPIHWQANGFQMGQQALVFPNWQRCEKMVLPWRVLREYHILATRGRGMPLRIQLTRVALQHLALPRLANDSRTHLRFECTS